MKKSLLWAILVITIVFLGCSASVLPSERQLMEMSPLEVNRTVLQYIPLGSDRIHFNSIFREKFKKRYEVRKTQSRKLMSSAGFELPIERGDYYIQSKFASKMVTLGASETLTVNFLFNGSNFLKEIAIVRGAEAP